MDPAPVEGHGSAVREVPPALVAPGVVAVVVPAAEAAGEDAAEHGWIREIERKES